ncbi:MAG: hypothetical protein ABIT83_15915 [Massilia sp.]
MQRNRVVAPAPRCGQRADQADKAVREAGILPIISAGGANRLKSTFLRSFSENS